MNTITSSSPETSDRSGRWFPIAMGIAAIILGAGIIWLYVFGTSEQDARKSWTKTSGMLKEVGLSYAPDPQYSPRYSLEARYSYVVDGQTLEGSRIDRAAVIYNFNEAKQLVMQFTADAANLSESDLTFLQSRKTWQLPFPGTDVEVRYDSANPRSAVLVSGHITPPKTLSPGVIWGIGLSFIIGGILVFVGLIADASKSDHLSADS